MYDHLINRQANRDKAKGYENENQEVNLHRSQAGCLGQGSRDSGERIQWELFCLNAI